MPRQPGPIERALPPLQELPEDATDADRRQHLEQRRARARVKAQALADAHAGTLTWVHDGVRISASGWRYIEELNVFEVTVAAHDHEGALPLLVNDNPFQFYNPPILDGDGEELAPVAMAKHLIQEAVFGAARKNGWRA